MGLNEMLMSIVGSEKGTYILILRADERFPVEVGKLGELVVKPGYYLYVGSAFGSGGLRSRINHHRKIASRPHWHIDYLRSVVNLEKVLFNDSGDRLEQEWVKQLEKMPEAVIPLPGFGASDSHAISHLFYFKTPPDLTGFDVTETVILD